MELNNNLSVLVSRKRWLKRIFKNFLPKIAKVKIFDKLDFYYDPRDMRGPSFHFGYDLEKGFLNYESENRDELLSSLPKNGVLYDIGANIGLYSVYAALKRKDIKIIGFEPDETVYNCISKTIKSFPDQEIKIFKKGVGLKNETLKLYHSSVNDGGHSFAVRDDEDEKQYIGYEEVEVVNLDDFIKSNNLPMPDVVKIDVEGFELEVLSGMKKTLEETAPVLMVESNNQDIIDEVGIWSFLNSLKGLEISAHGPDNKEKVNLAKLNEVARKKLSEGSRISNYFFFLDKIN
jgi:FkbM family methyltransferase